MQMVVTQVFFPGRPSVEANLATVDCRAKKALPEPLLSRASSTKKASVPTHHGSHQRTPEPQDSPIRDSQPVRTTDCDLVTRRPWVDAGGRWSSTLRARRTGLVDRQSSS
jgi:hypothetical protein